MIITYLWAKFCKKIRGSAIKNSRIHRSSKVNAGSQVVDSSMDRNSYCGYDCEILFCDIGSFCSIANNVTIGGCQHSVEWVSTSPVFRVGRDSISKKYAKHEYSGNKRTNIGNDVWIGERALIKQGVSIGNGSVIGMGSVVTHDVEPYSIVAGCPAKLIRRRFDDVIINKLQEIKWWEFTDEELLKYAPFFINPQSFIEKVTE